MSAGADPRTTYYLLGGDGAASEVPLTETFWNDLMSGALMLPQGYLVMAYDATEDMAHWERHPNGEELLVCLAGRVTVIEQTATGEAETRLTAGETYLVKRGLWHRLTVQDPGRMLHITWGDGTDHKPL